MALEFLIGTLAAWRIAALLTREDGPFGVFARLRARAGSGEVGRGLQCLYCTSVWSAAPLAGFVAPWSARSPVIWLALSGGACLLERATQRGLEVAPLDDVPGQHGG